MMYPRRAVTILLPSHWFSQESARRKNRKEDILHFLPSGGFLREPVTPPTVPLVLARIRPQEEYEGGHQ